jgi:hypothetical protein
MVQCKWCGYSLQPGMIACSSCGTAVPTSEDSTPGQFFQRQDAPAQPQQPFPGAWPSQQPLYLAGQAPAVEPPAYFSAPSPQASFANAQAQQPASAYYAQQSTPVIQPPPPQRRPPLSRGATITYAALALLALVSGLTLILYSAVFHPAQLHQQATATAIAQMNLAVSQTALANAQASATAIAITNATATAQALATAQAVATATALQNIYTQATNGTPVINDPLAGDNYNWDIGNTNDGGGCYFSGGAFHASVRTKNFFLPCIAHATNFSNFAYQVSMTFTHGNSGGIAFRVNANQQNGYLFNVTLGGIYGIFIIKNNQTSADLTSGQSAAINTRPNAANLLTIVARGNNIFMYVNKQFVTSITDGTYAAGQIGVFASDDTVASDVAFTKAEVWKL